ncbi:MAG: hypothetical protein KJZ75_17515 [Hyphomonadaceae bacterium]|nr:hypothetical protein [Hyphomonadaceae bacterium]
MMSVFEELRAASDDAMARIGGDPNRIAELADDDLTALAAHMKTVWPILECHLLAICGNDVDAANAALEHVAGFSPGKLSKLVRRGYVAVKARHANPTRNQLAALVINVQTGVGAVQVEQERRQALKVGAMN